MSKPTTFRVFFRHLPVRYGLIVLRTREYSTLADVEAAMRRKIVDFLFDNLVYFQAFDSVKIYYDDGQQSIAAALHKAIDYALHVPPRFGGRLPTLAGGRLHLRRRAHGAQV
ncbi:hypothetical protein [Olsenella sp. An293]|uniref:hypothetical protein n=1 Tax=Olsenella sp. An293 TaxID=1965626 RepID=UPI00194ED2E4|nr:hypothetical protein [Olsenella sp. An293]